MAACSGDGEDYRFASDAELAVTIDDGVLSAVVPENGGVLIGPADSLRDDRFCALHVAGEKELGTPFKLKPPICLLSPLCVVDGELDVGYASFTHRKQCCAPVRDGARTIYDVIGPRRRVDPHDGAPRELARRQRRDAEAAAPLSVRSRPPERLATAP